MAVRADVVLLADGGDVTVSRDAATFVYGEFKVIIPEGREQVETDRRLQDGYIYRPSDEVAPFDIGFSRADVTIDLEVQSTDLELVVDQAQRNADGDVFFERDITPAGLGEYVPGVDFQVGDVVSVDLRGRRMLLPVSEISMVSSESDGAAGWHVRVGGVLISDADELRRRYDAVRRQVANDKRELARSAGRAATAASRAQSTADSAVSDAASLREVLGGAQADEAVLVSQLAAVQAQIEGMVGDGESPPPPGMLNSYLWMNTKLWEQQQKINDAAAKFQAQQLEINEQKKKTDAAQDEASKAAQQAADAAQQAADTAQKQAADNGIMLAKIDDQQAFAMGLMARPLGAEKGQTDEDEYGKLWVSGTGVTFRPKGNWSGKVYIIIQIEALNNYSRLIVEPVTPNQSVFLDRYALQSINSALCLYKVTSVG